jgi:hypothetical protein
VISLPANSRPQQSEPAQPGHRPAPITISDVRLVVLIRRWWEVVDLVAGASRGVHYRPGSAQSGRLARLLLADIARIQTRLTSGGDAETTSLPAASAPQWVTL